MILTAITAGASRVASVPLCLHAVATTPAGPMKRIRSLLLHRLRPSPHYSWVGSCITFFEACSAFTRVTTCRLTESPYATLSTRGFSGFVTSTAAPIVTGWSDPVPGRVYLPLWTSTFSRRTVIEMLCQRFVADYASEPHDLMLSKRCGLLGGHSSNAQSSFQFEYVAAN